MAQTETLHSETGHESGATMPQMNPEYVSEQLIWLVITFAFLYVMMSRVALPRIGAVIEERRDKIADDLDKAAEFKREAERALAAYEQELNEARARAHTIIAEAREALKAETDTLRAQSDAKLAEHIKQAEARIREAKDEALTHVSDVAASTTLSLVEKLTGRSPEAQTVNAAVNSALSGLNDSPS